MEHIRQLVSADQVATWLFIALLVGYFIYKEWPEFKKRISKAPVTEAIEDADKKTLSGRLDSIESRLTTIEEKLNNDYTRLNNIESQSDRFERMTRESLEERGIIMNALLAVLQGLHELGANGPTAAAENTIKDYLNKKAHDAA